MPNIKTILIADDDKFMRLSLRKVLENNNYSVIETSDGQQAVKVYIELQPDCVLLDGLMPNLDGFDACNEIRITKSGKIVPIFIVSGLTRDEIKSNYPNTKATGYVEKPVDWSSLLKKISKL